jgi:hypothetical protein
MALCFSTLSSFDAGVKLVSNQMTNSGTHSYCRSKVDHQRFNSKAILGDTHVRYATMVVIVVLSWDSFSSVFSCQTCDSGFGRAYLSKEASQGTQVPPYRFIDSPAYVEYAAATHEVFVGEASRRSPHNFTDYTQLNSLPQ